MSALSIKHDFSISIDGNALDNFINVKIEQDINWHHRFQLTLGSLDLLEGLGKKVDWWDAPLDEQFDACKDCIGKKISAQISPSYEEGEGNFFKGIITNLSLSRSYGSHMEMVVSGYSPTILTSKGQDCVSYEEMTLSDIFNKVLNQYSGIDKELNPIFNAKIPYVVQYKESDFHFLYRLAQRYGEWFYYDGEKLLLGPPKKGKSAKLVLGANLPHFNLALNLEPLQFKHLQYNYVDNKVYEKSSKGENVKGLGDFGDFALKEADKLFSHEPLLPLEFLVPDEKNLKDALGHKRKMLANNLVQFTGTSRHADLGIGGVIEAKGKAADLDKQEDEVYGEFLVIKVNHFLDRQGNYENNFIAIPVNVEVPPVNPNVDLVQSETQVAVVKKNVDDPDGLGRVRVNFNWQKPNDLSPWLRIITAHAGKNKGMYFIPEEEEEVIIGFENGDPDRPFIIGSLYHGKNMPKDFKEGKNLIKAIRTKSNNEIQLYDEQGKESILIFNRDNQNEIILTLDEGGKIRIKTDNLLEMVAKDITMTASNNMTVEVGNNLDITVGKNKTESIGKKEEVTVGDNREVTVGKKIVYSSGTSSEWSAGTKIDVTSGTNMKFSAGANMNIAATGNLGAKANGNSTYESMGPLTVKTMANATVQGMMLKLQGQTMADLSGSAMVTIKGGMVMIN